MKYQPLPAEQEEQLRRLVAGCLARTGMHLVQPDELENLEPGQLGLTVSISMPGMGRIPPLTLAADPDRLRQALRPGPDLLRSGGLEVDCRRQLARADGALLGLTPKEFQLLAYLMKNQGLVLTRSQLLGAVWELDFSGDSRTVDTHIKCLRRKLGPYGGCIATIRKVGYRFDPAPDQESA